MQLNTVIFDMDGLLIDSEPLWNEAADEIFKQYQLYITPQQYATSTGMRVKEFVIWWFNLYKIQLKYAPKAEKDICDLVINNVQAKGKAMGGIEHIFNFFIERKFKIG